MLLLCIYLIRLCINVLLWSGVTIIIIIEYQWENLKNTLKYILRLDKYYDFYNQLAQIFKQPMIMSYVMTTCDVIAGTGPWTDLDAQMDVVPTQFDRGA